MTPPPLSLFQKFIRFGSGILPQKWWWWWCIDGDHDYHHDYHQSKSCAHLRMLQTLRWRSSGCRTGSRCSRSRTIQYSGFLPQLFRHAADISLYLILTFHNILGHIFLCFRILSTCSGCGLGYPKLFGSFRISNWVRFAMYSFIVFPFWSLCDDSCRDLINFLGQIGGRLQGQKTLLAFVVNTRPAIGDPYQDGHFFLSRKYF